MESCIQNIFWEHVGNVCPVSHVSNSYSISGSVSSSTTCFGSPDYQYLYVHNRRVHCSKLTGMLDGWFRLASQQDCAGDGTTLLARSMQRAYPGYLLIVSCPLDHYDVTLEPDKSEVVFKHMSTLKTLVLNALAPVWGKLPGALKDKSPIEDGGTHCNDDDVFQAIAALTKPRSSGQTYNLKQQDAFSAIAAEAAKQRNSGPHRIRASGPARASGPKAVVPMHGLQLASRTRSLAAAHVTRTTQPSTEVSIRCCLNTLLCSHAQLWTSACGSSTTLCGCKDVQSTHCHDITYASQCKMYCIAVSTSLQDIDNAADNHKSHEGSSHMLDQGLQGQPYAHPSRSTQMKSNEPHASGPTNSWLQTDVLRTGRWQDCGNGQPTTGVTAAMTTPKQPSPSSSEINCSLPDISPLDDRIFNVSSLQAEPDASHMSHMLPSSLTAKAIQQANSDLGSPVQLQHSISIPGALTPASISPLDTGFVDFQTNQHTAKDACIVSPAHLQANSTVPACHSPIPSLDWSFLPDSTSPVDNNHKPVAGITSPALNPDAIAHKSPLCIQPLNFTADQSMPEHQPRAVQSPHPPASAESAGSCCNQTSAAPVSPATTSPQHTPDMSASASSNRDLKPFTERLIMSAPPHAKKVHRGAHSNPVASLYSRSHSGSAAGHNSSKNRATVSGVLSRAASGASNGRDSAAASRRQVGQVSRQPATDGNAVTTDQLEMTAASNPNPFTAAPSNITVDKDCQMAATTDVGTCEVVDRHSAGGIKGEVTATSTGDQQQLKSILMQQHKTEHQDQRPSKRQKQVRFSGLQSHVDVEQGVRTGAALAENSQPRTQQDILPVFQNLRSAAAAASGLTKSRCATTQAESPRIPSEGQGVMLTDSMQLPSPAEQQTAHVGQRTAGGTHQQQQPVTTNQQQQQHLVPAALALGEPPRPCTTDEEGAPPDAGPASATPLWSFTTTAAAAGGRSILSIEHLPVSTEAGYLVPNAITREALLTAQVITQVSFQLAEYISPRCPLVWLLSTCNTTRVLAGAADLSTEAPDFYAWNFAVRPAACSLNHCISQLKNNSTHCAQHCAAGGPKDYHDPVWRYPGGCGPACCR